MSTVSDILTGIKAIVADELGNTYRELPFSLDVAKNRFAGGTRAYAVWAGAMLESTGLVGSVTIDHSFELVLTETFATSQVGDAAQRAAGEALYSRAESIYVRIAAERPGFLLAQRFTAQPIQFIDSNVAVFRATFDLKYRQARIA